MWIALFKEQIQVPCTVFLSDKDSLIDASFVETYFRNQGVPVCDSTKATRAFFDASEIQVCVFRGSVHGDFTDHPHLLPPIAEACDSLCCGIEGFQ